MAAFETAKLYSERGSSVTTVCFPDSRLGEKLTREGMRSIALKSRGYVDPAAIAKIRTLVRTQNVGTVILHRLKDIWFAAPALLGLPRVKLVGFAHMFLSVNKKDPLHRWLYSRMDALICLTEIQRRNFIEHLPIDPSKVQVVPNGVDRSRFKPELRNSKTRESLGASETDFLIGVVGRLDELKGQLETVDAAKILRDAGLCFKLVLVGEETMHEKGMKDRLEGRIRSHALTDVVRLAGFRSDIPEIVASLDVLAMPSWAETFGRVLIEAMAARVPVVATQAGGVADIVADGIDGILVPPRDATALAAAFQRYLKDSDLRARIANTGYQKAASKYDLQVVLRQLDEILL